MTKHTPGPTFRELLLALEEGGVFVPLSDARSPVFFQDGPQGSRGLMPVVMSLLPEHVRRRVVLVTVQEGRGPCVSCSV